MTAQHRPKPAPESRYGNVGVDKRSRFPVVTSRKSVEVSSLRIAKSGCHVRTTKQRSGNQHTTSAAATCVTPPINLSQIRANASGLPDACSYSSSDRQQGGDFTLSTRNALSAIKWTCRYFSLKRRRRQPGSVSGLIASTGHSGSQTPQSMHSSRWITSMFSPSQKQSTGHTSTQSMVLQRMQLSLTA